MIWLVCRADLEAVLIGHVALDERHLLDLVLVENELQAVQVFLEIVDKNLVAA